ncbi:hypothetical protein SK128_004199, partial [Halocaridina rubra]
REEGRMTETLSEGEETVLNDTKALKDKATGTPLAGREEARMTETPCWEEQEMKDTKTVKEKATETPCWGITRNERHKDRERQGDRHALSIGRRDDRH